MLRVVCVLQYLMSGLLRVHHKAGGRCAFDHLLQSSRRGALNPDLSPCTSLSLCVSFSACSLHNIAEVFQTDRQRACSEGAHWGSTQQVEVEVGRWGCNWL